MHSQKGIEVINVVHTIEKKNFFRCHCQRKELNKLYDVHIPTFFKQFLKLNEKTTFWKFSIKQYDYSKY